MWTKNSSIYVRLALKITICYKYLERKKQSQRSVKSCEIAYNTCITFWQWPHPFCIWIQMHRIYKSQRFQTIFWLCGKLKCKHTTRNTLYSCNLHVLFWTCGVLFQAKTVTACYLSFSNRPKRNLPKVHGLCSKLLIKPLAKAFTRKMPFFLLTVFLVTANKFAFCIRTSCTQPLHLNAFLTLLMPS